MEKIALNIPGNTGSINIPNPPGLQTPNPTLGGLVSSSLNVVLLIAGFLLLFWFSWGVFQYIFAGGKKEALAKARTRIVWAIVGFIFVFLTFAISEYAKTLLPYRTNQPVKQITTPPN